MLWRASGEMHAPSLPSRLILPMMLPLMPRIVCVLSLTNADGCSGRWWFGAVPGGRTLKCPCGQGCKPGEAGDDADALEQAAEINKAG